MPDGTRPSSLHDAVAELRHDAGFFRARRRRDGDLYSLLGRCLALCERVEREGSHDELRALIRSSSNERRYTETASDVYVLVGRAVLQADDTRNSWYRYAATLREAARAGIAAADLPGWLAEHGGVNALFRARPTAARTATTRTLNLTESVTVPQDRPFTLTLERQPTGFFAVLTVEPADA